MKIEIRTNNEEQTMAVAEKLAKSFSVPQVISLVGDLGAGKTTFAKGVAKGLKIEKMVTSPTFTILNEYLDGKTKLYHFDMYRLESEEEARAVGFESYFDLQSLDGITLVEWAENTKGILPSKFIQVSIEKIDDDQRKISIELIELGDKK